MDVLRVSLRRDPVAGTIDTIRDVPSSGNDTNNQELSFLSDEKKEGRLASTIELSLLVEVA